VRVAIALLAVTVIVMGAPFWGNDFGGAVAAAPGFVLLGWLLLGPRVALADGVGAGRRADAAAVGGRGRRAPPGGPTHARGQVLREGGHRISSATLVLAAQGVGEPLDARHSLLVVCLIALAVLVLYLWFMRPRSLRTSSRACPHRVHDRPRAGVVAVLGFALTDSGVSIPG